MTQDFDYSKSITSQLISIHRDTVKKPYFIRATLSFFKRKFFGSCGVFLKHSNRRKKNFVNNEILEGYINKWRNKPEIIYIYGYEDPIYYPKYDKILTLSKGFFLTPLMYYQLMFHELGHSTMHPKRMNREAYKIISDDLPEEEEMFMEAEEEILVTFFSIKVCMLSTPPIDELNKIMWFNSNIFSKFADIICEIDPTYNFKLLEDQADDLVEYMLKQIN